MCPVNLHLSQSDLGDSSCMCPHVALLFVVPTYVIDTHYDGTMCPDPISPLFINVHIFYVCMWLFQWVKAAVFSPESWNRGGAVPPPRKQPRENPGKQSATFCYSDTSPTGTRVFVAVEFGLGCVYMAGDGNHWWLREQCLYVPGTVPLQMPTVLFQPHRPLEVWI